MNEPKDPESTNEQNASSDASAAGMPWHLPGAEELALPAEEEQEVDEQLDEASQNQNVEALTIWCPDCGQEMHISREHLGMQGACLNCHLPIVASMHPDENGSMRVTASKVGSPEVDLTAVVEPEHGESEAVAIAENEVGELQAGTAEEAMVEEGDAEEAVVEDVENLQEGVDPLLTEESSSVIPLPSWMEGSSSDGEESEDDLSEPEEVSDETDVDEGEENTEKIDEGLEESSSDGEESQDEEESLSVPLGDEDETELEEEDGEAESGDEDLDDDESEGSEEEVAPAIPLPSWMTKSSADGEESEDEEESLSVPLSDDEDETELEEEDDEALGIDEDLDDDAPEGREQEVAPVIPLPSWMTKSSADGEESQDEEESLSVSLSDEDETELEEEDGEEEGGEAESGDEDSDEEESEGNDKSQDEEESLSVPLNDEDDETELEEEGGEAESGDEDLDEDESEGNDKSQDEETEDEQAPSWVKGGNPWDGLGLNKQETDEDEEGDDVKEESGDLSEDEQESEESEDFPSLLPEVKAEEKTSEPEDEESESEEEASIKDEGEEGEPEDEESRLGLIIAAVIILVVGGAGGAVFLKPDLIKGKAAVESKAVVENTSSTKGDEESKQDKPAIEKPAEQDALDEKSAKADADEMDKKGDAESKKEKLASNEPKAVERPQGQSRKEVVGQTATASSTPQMATTRAEIHDGVALRMHQEGERTIRSFYRANSVEERSAFVLQPSKALERMRSFYVKTGALPTLRYVEFVGLVSDPTSGFRFGVFDVHEKENETSHRWSVVEVDPGRYAMDWGLYEQLEGSTLVAYLAKPKKDPEKFRLLMKLGESVLVKDSPWAEEAIKVYLQLPLASSGAEIILMKRSMAKKMGILGELAGGKMKIGQVEIEWVAGDKDPGSKVPTITGFDGWGAWSKLKMRGLK